MRARNKGWIYHLREADRLRSEHRYQEAEAVYVLAREQAKNLVDKEPLAIRLNHMGHQYQSTGRIRAAQRAYAEALAIVERKHGSASQIVVQLANR